VPVRLSIIVPFHKDLGSLERCLEALTARPADAEVIVAADGAIEDCHPAALRHDAKVIEVPGPAGPAVARNAAARAAAGDVLVFVDADVVISPGALDRIVDTFDRQPSTSAVFGAYDDHPWDPGFFSQYKNLAHAFVHRTSATSTRTFWAGFGAVRRASLLAVGGFDERFGRPSVEDIDFGYRLTAAGHRVVLDPALSASHLKRWTFASMVVSDVRDRGIPWTQLLHRYGGMHDDLNLRHGYRLAVGLAYAAVAALALAFVDIRFAWIAAILFAGQAALGRQYYSFFSRKRGVLFAIRVFPVHVLHHLFNGLSFAVGTALYLANRLCDGRLLVALPLDPWPPPVDKAGSVAGV
jgi:GT2 family glycosyltransferase